MNRFRQRDDTVAGFFVQSVQIGTLVHVAAFLNGFEKIGFCLAHLRFDPKQVACLMGT